MTIREIERRTGLDRTNIRFYEREGLITPARHENGYRDYSENDLQLLMKLKLFRRLGFSLDAIRAMKDDDDKMERVLSERLSSIDETRRRLDAAEQVCQKLHSDGARFSTLDAKIYLDSFDRILNQTGTNAALAESVPAADCIEPIHCPLRRFFARSFDLGLIHIAVLAVLSLLARSKVTAFSTFAQWFWMFAAMLCWLLLEPLLLAKLGTTPGKWLLGIRLEHIDGRRLTYSEAFSRSERVFSRGQGLCIPIVNLFCLGKSLRTYMKQGKMSWDDETEVIAAESRPRFVFRYLAAELAAALLLVVVVFSPWMPPNRGELTVQEFVENFNTLAEYHKLDYLVLCPDGTVETRRNNASSNQSTSDLINFIVSLDEGEPLQLIFTEENGILTAVSYDRVATNAWGGSYSDYIGKTAIQLTTQAFAWADTNLFSALFSSPRLKPFYNLANGTQTASISGCSLVYTISPLPDQAGEDEDAPNRIRVTFSITGNQ